MAKHTIHKSKNWIKLGKNAVFIANTPSIKSKNWIKLFETLATIEKKLEYTDDFCQL
jgi:hypothetical protein